MKIKILPSIFVITMLCLSACTGTTSKTQINPVKCENPRPQICTMIYKPVCGISKSGAKKTYASACTACSDENVVAFEKEECR